MPEDRDKNAPTPQRADGSVHVARDSAPTGAELALEARRFIWMAALTRCSRMLRTAIRSREWAEQAGLKWDFADQSFPTPVDGALISTSLAQMAVITFLTVFKPGTEDKGNVAGNRDAPIASFREACVRQAFPEASDRAAFVALCQRLEEARDCLLAHADGGAQEMEHSENLSSFGPQDGGVALEDIGPLLDCVERLLKAVQIMRMRPAGQGSR